MVVVIKSMEAGAMSKNDGSHGAIQNEDSLEDMMGKITDFQKSYLQKLQDFSSDSSGEDNSGLDDVADLGLGDLQGMMNQLVGMQKNLMDQVSSDIGEEEKGAVDLASDMLTDIKKHIKALRIKVKKIEGSIEKLTERLEALEG